MMADVETLLNLEADEPAVAAYLADHDGRLVRDEADAAAYWLDLRPASASEERYYVLVRWVAYPFQAPSIKFADGVYGSLTVTRAWPIVPGYRSTSFDICKPLSAEGYALHQEWRTGPDAWPTEGNPFLWVAETLQYDLNNQYGGRAA